MASLRAAINDFCKQCIHDPYSGDGSWLQQVTHCTAKTCPLYEVRPMRKKATDHAVTPELSARMRALRTRRFEA